MPHLVSRSAITSYCVGGLPCARHLVRVAPPSCTLHMTDSQFCSGYHSYYVSPRRDARRPLHVVRRRGASLLPDIFSTQMLAWPSLDLPVAISAQRLFVIACFSRLRVFFFPLDICFSVVLDCFIKVGPRVWVVFAGFRFALSERSTTVRLC